MLHVTRRSPQSGTDEWIEPTWGCAAGHVTAQVESKEWLWRFSRLKILEEMRSLFRRADGQHVRLLETPLGNVTFSSPGRLCYGWGACRRRTAPGRSPGRGFSIATETFQALGPP